jgi:hypothetical protein
MYIVAVLQGGLTKSCGCLQKEIASEIGKRTIKLNTYDNKKYNKYDLESFDYGIGWTSNTNKPFIFDKDDFDLIKERCWRENCTNGYIVTSYDGKESNAMHRIIMNAKDGEYIDHINRDRTDNRKSNLRFATLQQNNYNKDRSNNGSSGHKGVSWSKTMNKWEAYINKNYKRFILGYYTNIEEAIKVREEAENKYFEEFSYDNSELLSSSKSKTLQNKGE